MQIDKAFFITSLSKIKRGALFLIKSKAFKIAFSLLIIAAIIITRQCNNAVEDGSKGYIYTDLNKIPANKVGVLLGTSRHLTNGTPNPFFYYRIKAASALFFSGKIRYILVSGDNRYFSYNEPREMRRELMRAGIPDTSIIMDFAGFRTLDSVVRAKKVFGLKKFTIISQEFHNERAIYIARFNDIDAVAYNAVDPPDDFTLQVRIREYFARAMVVIDLYLLNKKPYFLGNPVRIGNN
jgi:SanA protein